MEAVKIRSLRPGNIFAFELLLHNRESYVVDGVNYHKIHITNRGNDEDSGWIDKTDVYVYLLGQW